MGTATGSCPGVRDVAFASRHRCDIRGILVYSFPRIKANNPHSSESFVFLKPELHLEMGDRQLETFLLKTARDVKHAVSLEVFLSRLVN